MTKEDSSSAFKIETVKKIYDAISRYDVPAYLSFFDAKVKRFETFGSRCQGLEELKANLTSGRDNWAEGSCEPEQLTVLGNKVVVFVHVHVRLKNKDEWIDGQVTDIFVFEGTQVVEFNSFGDRDEALKWAEHQN